LYDVGHHGHTDFLVMEYLGGETLEDRIRRPEGLRLPRELEDRIGSGKPSGLPVDEALAVAVLPRRRD
jgi:hypothetical protein